MFRSILVPLDGTRFAEAALPIASRLARGGPARLNLVLAHQPVAALVGMGPDVLTPASLDEEMRNQETGYLMNVAAELVLNGTETVDYREVDGPVGPAIGEEAARVGADLVVMAAHSRGLVGRLWHGSVADHLIRHLSVPVLVLHENRPKSRLAKGPMRGILVALDLSPGSEAILEPVEKLARSTNAPVTLVHMIPDPMFELGRRPGPSAGHYPAMAVIPRAEAGQRLEAIAEPLRNRGLRVCTRVVAGFNPAWALRDMVAESQFDVLALTTHGAGGIRRMWMGSVADQVVREANKPVLVFRPPEEARP